MRSPPPSTVELSRDIIGTIPVGSRVLEFACALGRTAFRLEEMGYDVCAFDIDPGSVRAAEKAALSMGSGVEFMTADGRSLPLKDGSFDACVMNAYMTMMTDPDSRRRSVSEACRILVGGGYLYVADFLRNPELPEYRKRYREHQDLTGEEGTFIVYESGEGSRELYRAHHYTEEELLGYLEGLFRVLIQRKTRFRSYHGNELDGIIILARKL